MKPTFAFIREGDSIRWRIEYEGETVGSTTLERESGSHGTSLAFGSSGHGRLCAEGLLAAFWAAANYFAVDNSHGRDGTPAVNQADNTKVIARLNRAEYSVECVEGEPGSISTFFCDPFGAKDGEGNK